jgi:hypothetical protein
VSSPHDRPAPHFDPSRIAARQRQIDWQSLESIVHRDPAARGLASFRQAQLPLDAGALQAAALQLAQHGSTVGLVTGFCAVVGQQVTAETDGPPGALFLARSLAALGIEVVVISDRYALPLLEAGCDLWGLDRKILLEFPFETGPPDAPARASNAAPFNVQSDRWVDAFFSRGSGQRLSHLIAIERPGPSHTQQSLAAQASRRSAPPVERFLAEVPAEHRDVCHNMRGESINGHVAKTHRLFEEIRQRRLPITTIGIGDGGNELGMGQYAWDALVEAIGDDSAARIACRVATDFAMIAGVSDWASYALALTVARLRGGDELGRDWDAVGQRDLIEALVTKTGAVDGVTLRHEPTVDGLPLDDYLQPLVDLRQQLGFAGARDA